MSMFKTKSVISNAVEATLQLLRQRKRGDVVTWAELETTADFDRDSKHWTAYDRRFRRDFLKETGIKLFAVSGTGLKLMTASEQLLDESRQRRANRQLWRGNKELESLPGRELSDHQQVVKSRRLDLGRTARRAALYVVRQTALLARTTTSDVPRRKQATDRPV